MLEMKVGIMQPYFMPYIGYWQLINVVDKFVLLDDVNYIMRGYINRNSILLNGKPYRFTLPVENASQNKLIMDTKLRFAQEKKQDFFKTISNAYGKAPCYRKVAPIIEDIINNSDDDITEYIKYSIQKSRIFKNVIHFICCFCKEVFLSYKTKIPLYFRCIRFFSQIIALSGSFKYTP